MAKWLSFVAFLIAAGAAYLGMESKGLVDKLQTKGAELSKNLADTKRTLATTQDELKATKATLETTTKDLETTKAAKVEVETNLAAVNKQLADITTQIKEALGPDAGDIGAGIGNLKEKITQLTTAKSTMEAQVTSLTADKTKLEGDVGNLQKELAEAKGVIASLELTTKNLTETTTVQKKNIDRYEQQIMLKGTRGRVLAVNSGWGFCVISIGDKAGAAPNKQLIVARGGQAIGKIKITNVERSQSIADILPNTFTAGSFVQPGDDVIFVGDEKLTPAAAGAADGGNSAAPALPSRN